MSAGEWFAWGLAMALLAAAGVACRLGARAARRDAELLAAARLLELLLSLDLGAMALKLLVLEPARSGGHVPYEGAARLAFHATQLAFLAWPFGAAWIAWRLFARGPGHALLAGAWGACALLLAARYPALRGEALLGAYRWVHVGCLLGALASLLAPRPDRFRAGRAHLVALLVVAGAAAELAGPYVAAPFASWWTAQASWSLALAAVALAATWRRPWRTLTAS